MSNQTNKYLINGFAIVELLVIVVVIGILAVITLKSYSSNVQPKETTKESLTAFSIQTELSNISSRLKIDQAGSVDGLYPVSLELANNGIGIVKIPDVTYQYSVDNNSNPKTFCVSITKESVSYMITDNSAPVTGVCTSLDK